MSITNFYIIDVTEFKKKNTKFIFLQNLKALQGGITFFLSRRTTTNILTVFKVKTVVANLNSKWHFGNVVVYVYGSLDQSVKLSWAKPFRLASSRMSPSLNPV